MKAINPKNQALVNKAIQWLEKHNAFNDQRNIADDIGDEKAYNKLDKKCESSYDKFLEYMEELPKNQQNLIYKSDLY